MDSKVFSGILAQLESSFKDLSSEKEAARFLDSLFTETERLMLAKRLAIAVLLEEGITYDRISRWLKVSPVTVGFVQNNKLKGNAAYQALIKQLKKVVPLPARDQKIS